MIRYPVLWPLSVPVIGGHKNGSRRLLLHAHTSPL